MGLGKADGEEDRVCGPESGAIELVIGLSNRKYWFMAAGLIRESHSGNEHHRRIALLGIARVQGPERGGVRQPRPQVRTRSMHSCLEEWDGEAEPRKKCSCKQNHGITATRTNPGFTAFYTKRHAKEKRLKRLFAKGCEASASAVQWRQQGGL